MNVAVLGAGFAGLACSYYACQKGAAVTLFDPNGIGGGASGVASGLLHPYPGEKARLSRDGMEAMEAAKELLSVAGNGTFVQDGIERYPVSDEQRKLFSEKEEWDGEKLMFSDGITVFARPYLAQLFAACRGIELVQATLCEDEFSRFDHVIVAVGAGIRSFSFCDSLPLRFIKGQVLHCARPSFLKRSLIAKGYIATTQDPNVCIVGSTYEHDFATDGVDIEEAKRQILPRIAMHVPFDEPLEVLCAEAGVRVANKHEYYPIAERIAENISVLTALGSRGLLYHAFLARKLVNNL